MYEAKSKEIDGLNVVVTEWPARKALMTKLRLSRIVTPSIGELIGGANSINQDSLLDSDVDLEKVGSAIGTLMSDLTDDQFKWLIKIMMSCVHVDDMDMSDEKNFDVKFAGSLASFYKIVWFVLEVNYGSFFGKGGIGKAVEKIKTKMSALSVPSKS